MDKPDEISQTLAAITLFQSAYFPMIAIGNYPTEAILQAVLPALEFYLPETTEQKPCGCKN